MRTRFFPLSFADVYNDLEVIGFRGEGTAINRLKSIGIDKGSLVRVINNKSGRIILELRRTKCLIQCPFINSCHSNVIRLELSFGEAMSILVKKK